MRSSLVIFLAVSLILSIGIKADLAAQQQDLAPIYSGWFTSNPSWSSDSTKFAFGSEGFLSDLMNGTGQWYVYEVYTRTLSERNRWPLSSIPSITRELFENLSTEVVEQAQFTYRSPNWRYLVSPGRREIQRPSGNFSATVLVDIQANEVFDLPLEVPAAYPAPRSFQVVWSDDSSAFTLGTAPLLVPDLSFFTYVSGYASADASEEQTLITRNFTEFSYDERPFNVQGVYDLSPTGTQVLFQSVESASEYPVFIWNAETNSYRKIADLSAPSYIQTDAMFDEAGTGFYIINDSGIIHYELETGETTLIRADISSMWVDRAFFSPNGNWLALFDYRADGSTDIYMVEVNLGAT